MIVEYNGLTTFSTGQAVLIPTSPFRLGGLRPNGFQTIPVLAYSTIAETSSSPGQLDRSTFEEQMGWLKNGGFTPITPNQLLDFMDFSGQVPQRSVLITLDTEALTFIDLALPILNALGFTATLFVATDRIGKEASMTWHHLQQVRDAGFTIGSRGHDDRSLTDRQPGQAFEVYFKAIEANLQAARDRITHHLGSPPPVLAYPDGPDSDLMAAMAAKLGFSSAFVNVSGENPFFGGRFRIHRHRIDRRLTPEAFHARLTSRVDVDLNP
jgi:peptidoglycan/xylan/chitin deacetylase (PgdA/CDA1 family)